MGFSNYIALTALISMPIIIILYMLKPKNTPHLLPSLYLWKAMANEIESASRIHKLKSSILMLLQLLAALLIALMLAGLFIKSSQLPKQAIVIVDCSVSMKSVDITPTRMEEAKEQAQTYIKQLDKEAEVTLIALKDQPELLLSGEKDKALIISALKSLQPVDAYADTQQLYQLLETLQKNEEIKIVYFGDRAIKGAENIIVAKSTENIAVNNLTYTAYQSDKELRILADIYNEGKQTVSVPVSLYVEDKLFDAKQINLESGQTGKVFFDKVPLTAKRLSVKVDKEDILQADNQAYSSVVQNQDKKAVLVTNSNVFLEKVLKLNKSISLYKAEEKNKDTLKGFQLYIFDGVMPAKLPKDGAVLLFNPPEGNIIEVLGYGQNPELFTTGHPVTSHIQKPDFAIAETQIYKVPTWATSILDTQYGSCAIAGTYNNTRIVCFGFDLHNTDMPLVVEFPIIMTNTVNQLVPDSLLLASSISAGEAMAVRILPDTKEAYIINPDGIKEQLDTSKEEVLYKSTLKTGMYTMLQSNGKKEQKEHFGVNVPKISEADNETAELAKNNLQKNSRKSLYLLLGAAVLAVILAEWWIYHYRRKTDELKL